MNHRPAPSDNVNYRKAISHAFPYEVFVDKAMLGHVDRIKSPIPKGVFGSPKDLAGYGHDLKKAREYLQLAAKDGVHIKQEIEVRALTSYDETVSVAQLLQSELRKIGVTLPISRGNWINLVTACQKLETLAQIWSHWSTPHYVDPDNWTGPYYTKAGHGTTRGSSWHSSDKVHRLLVDASQAADHARRVSLYEEASRLMRPRTTRLFQRSAGARPLQVGRARSEEGCGEKSRRQRDLDGGASSAEEGVTCARSARSRHRFSATSLTVRQKTDLYDWQPIEKVTARTRIPEQVLIPAFPAYNRVLTRELSLSVKTVSTYRIRLMEKMGLASPATSPATRRISSGIFELVHPSSNFWERHAKRR